MARKKKPNIRKSIVDGKAALKEIMQEGLAKIAESMIAGVMAKARNLPPSRQLEAIKDLDNAGIQSYRDQLLTGIAIIASDALAQARKEVPKKKNVKLGIADQSILLAEFDNLPPDLQRKVKTQTELLINTQVNDLEKALSFQYVSSIDSTEGLDLVQKDMEGTAEDFITGASIDGGSAATASQMINQARDAFFGDDEVGDAIEAYQFVNGDPVSPICQDLAGTIFAKDDPEADRYTPPLHFNCKSYIVPILKGNLGGREIGELKPSRAELDKYVQFSEHGCVGHDH